MPPSAARTLLLACALSAAAAAQHPITTTVVGRVLGHLGEPVQGLEVTAVLPDGPAAPVAQARTGTDGAFLLTHVPAGVVLWVQATAPGLTVGRAYLVADPRQPNVIRLRLWQAIAVRGRVLDADGAPIAGAQVVGGRDQRQFEGGCAPVEATTDEHGAFELRGLPLGDYALRAWAPGFALRPFWYSAVADEERVLPLARSSGKALHVEAVGLTPDAARTTRARLRAGPFLPRALADGVLDDDSRWQAEGLNGIDGSVTLVAPGHVFAPRTQPFAASALPAELQFVGRALHALVLHGSVCDGAGEPLAGQTIVRELLSGDPMRLARETAVIGADGRFELAVSAFAGERITLFLADSPYVLLPETGAEGAREVTQDHLTRVALIANPERAPKLGAVRGARVRARVRDRDGAPVPFAPVDLQDSMRNRSPEWSTLERGITGPDGTVAFATVPVIADAVRVRSSGPGGSGESAPWTLAAGESEVVEVRVVPNGSVAGRVLSADGRPRAGIEVVIRDCDPATGAQTPGHVALVPTDRDGRFRFVDVLPGGHRLVLRAGSKDEVLQPVVTVAAGGTVAQDIVDR